mmetsp:Transcript_13953/g.35058  ORF Transcript_13953/g.35058 Transcript_13953/m.35058 type:complete len:281 (-) Transcript_13953:252-1094(-)
MVAQSELSVDQRCGRKYQVLVSFDCTRAVHRFSQWPGHSRAEFFTQRHEICLVRRRFQGSGVGLGDPLGRTRIGGTRMGRQNHTVASTIQHNCQWQQGQPGETLGSPAGIVSVDSVRAQKYRHKGGMEQQRELAGHSEPRSADQAVRYSCHEGNGEPQGTPQRSYKPRVASIARKCVGIRCHGRNAIVLESGCQGKRGTISPGPLCTRYGYMGFAMAPCRSHARQRFQRSSNKVLGSKSLGQHRRIAGRDRRQGRRIADGRNRAWQSRGYCHWSTRSHNH